MDFRGIGIPISPLQGPAAVETSQAGAGGVATSRGEETRERQSIPQPLPASRVSAFPGLGFLMWGFGMCCSLPLGRRAPRGMAPGADRTASCLSALGAIVDGFWLNAHGLRGLVLRRGKYRGLLSGAGQDRPDLPMASLGSMASRRWNLDPPAAFGVTQAAGSRELVPPSHFQARPPAAPSWARAGVQLEVLELRRENQQLRAAMWGWGGGRAAAEDPGSGARFRDQEQSQGLSQQAQLVSPQPQELPRLEAEAQQGAKLEAQAEELEALGRAEVEELRASLARAEEARLRLEEGGQQELEAARRQHEEEVAHLTQAHLEALSTLRGQVQELHETVQELEARRGQEAMALAAAQAEADTLQEQLKKSREELEARDSLVRQLRRHVSEQGVAQSRCQAWEQERGELQQAVKRLQEERAALSSTSELLQVRVQSLTDILTLQERELAQKAPNVNILEPESARKARALLSRWREKVFSLMVQLKAQELSHAKHTCQLQKEVAELEKEVASQRQQEALLLHSLKGKEAEIQMEQVNSKVLQGELSRSQDSKQQLQDQVQAAEEQVQLLSESVHSSQQGLLARMAEVEVALAQLPGLSTRLSYAARQVRILQGLVARKVALAQIRQEESAPAPAEAEALDTELRQLREERSRQDAELRFSARLLQQEVARARDQGREERQRLAEASQRLERELRESREALGEAEARLEAALAGQRDSQDQAASLRRELGKQQEVYERVLQEKVSEVEARLREPLAALEKELSAARREHSKAVVSLRQVQRQAARDRERNLELRRLHEEARQEQEARTSRRLQQLERDKHLLLNTLRQEGLVSRYKQQRLTFLPRLLPASGEPTEPSVGPRPRTPPKESLVAVLDGLQSLSTAITQEEEEEEEEEGGGGDPKTSG
ncbi:coiled-coil alpha-helical rod protein 1 isoform X2 [Ornithorhynchus anatinus]|uniref:coiled-coil alpha-helical rod protein 1 isoform X2 n=1 Tax=Ornithorhynchus anatinus TaxID=9258 RepID=UPI0010A81286|nr:coiled-coil alpha-helical rod protein 1 isoform X2 [Ornithorhynchus anatinus]